MAFIHKSRKKSGKDVRMNDDIPLHQEIKGYLKTGLKEEEIGYIMHVKKDEIRSAQRDLERGMRKPMAFFK